MQNEIDIIYITYKNRFVRFGYEWFERLCKMYDTKIMVLNNVETSPPSQEMIDDMVSIIHVFLVVYLVCESIRLKFKTTNL